MFTSFRVKNYRCFRDLTVEPLERVNLIAGKNNVGKSALLEALWLCCQYNDPVISDLLTRYRGLKESELGNYLVSLLPEFDAQKGIEILVTESDGEMHSIALTMIPVGPSDGPRTGTETQTAPGASQVRSKSAYPASFEVAYQGSKPGAGPESDRVVMRDGKIMAAGRRSSGLKRVSFLAARGPEDSEALVEKLSEVVFFKESERVLEALQVVEPRLERLHLVSRDGRLVIHGDIGLTTLMPLPLLGEGVSRLLSVVLGVASARNGLLLVEEIENGLHYSVMKSVWQAIASAARKFDVQVFATTHSKECIRAAHEAFTEGDIYDFRLHRLDLIKGVIESVTYDRKALAFALDAGWEVR